MISGVRCIAGGLVFRLARSAQPYRPDGVHRRMRYRTREYTTPREPCASIEDSRDGCKDEVPTVEEGGALVEVGETEDGGRDHQSSSGAHAALQQILHQPAKEELFR